MHKYLQSNLKSVSDKRNCHDFKEGELKKCLQIIFQLNLERQTVIRCGRDQEIPGRVGSVHKVRKIEI